MDYRRRTPLGTESQTVRVSCVRIWNSDIFVATDGGGGRLFGFDRADGHETFNFRPALGGLAHTHFFEDAQTAVTSVAMKKSHWVASRLFIFKTDTKSMDFASSCWGFSADGPEELSLSMARKNVGFLLWI